MLIEITRVFGEKYRNGSVIARIVRANFHAFFLSIRKFQASLVTLDLD